MGFTSHREECLAALNSAASRALEICGGLAETYAKQLCPKDTGRLQNSISHAQVDERTEVIGTNVEYAPFVELGHHQTPGRYVPAIGKRLKREWIPPQPFLRPAVENHAEEYKRIFENELRKG